MQIVTDERVARYVAAHVNIMIVPPYTCLGVETNGQIVGGVVFNCFTGNDIEATVAFERQVYRRAFLKAVHEYVFTQLGCLRISITTEQPEVVRLAERLGAQIEGLKRNHFGVGRDAFLLGILKDDWIFT